MTPRWSLFLSLLCSIPLPLLAQEGAGSTFEGSGRSGPQRARHVIETIGLEAGHTVADLGCGGGWLSQAFSEVVGEAGHVYAVEISERWVVRVRGLNLPNTTVVHSKPSDVSLPENSLDIAVLHDVASHLRGDRAAFYASVARALEPDGKLVIFGPHGEGRERLAELRPFRFRAEGEAELLALPDDELDRKHWDGITFRHLAAGTKRQVRGDRASRDRRAAHVIALAGIEPGDTVADIGFGGGWLTERLSRHVGERGLVYGVEVREKSVEFLREKGLPNVVGILGEHGDVSLDAGSLDVAILHDVASHVRKESRRSFYASVARAMKREGKLVIFAPHGKARAMLAELRLYGFHPAGETALLALDDEVLDDWIWDGLVLRYTGDHLY